MMTRLLKAMPIAALALLTLPAGAQSPVAAPVDTTAPTPLIETAANAMLKDLEVHRPEYKKDPKKIYALVDRVLLPNFDVDYAARLVLGKHWRDASDAQKKRFVDAFYHSLLNNYGDALVDFTGDRIRIIPTPVDANATTAVVRTEVKRSNGQKIPVNYSLRKTASGWKAWDVTIEGISYVKSFREDFGAEIEQKGLDAVIQRLESQQDTPAPGKAGVPARAAASK
jgi:phospholipid transport system substrate-binding protein